MSSVFEDGKWSQTIPDYVVGFSDQFVLINYLMQQK